MFSLKAAPFVYDHGWQIDPEGFRKAITPATRAIVLVHPNNPTGHFTKAWEAKELAALCRELGLALIVDEVFLDYPFEPGSLGFRHPGAGEPAGRRVLSRASKAFPVFVVSGLSKIAGLPQMKAAWMHVATGSRVEASAMERLEVIADTFLSMNAPVQWALPAWLAGRSRSLDPRRFAAGRSGTTMGWRSRALRGLKARPGTWRIREAGGA